MTIPTLLFGIFLSTLYGAAFHFWRGGDIPRLVSYLLLAWAGFWSGHFLGTALAISFWQMGALNVGAATIGAALFLYAGHLAIHYLLPKK